MTKENRKKTYDEYMARGKTKWAEDVFKGPVGQAELAEYTAKKPVEKPKETPKDVKSR